MATKAQIFFPGITGFRYVDNDLRRFGLFLRAWNDDKTGSSLADLATRTHALLTGKDADDHVLYHTDARGDARYPLKNAIITGSTRTKITYDAKGFVTAGTDATTADIADSTNKRYVTDAQLVVVGNTYNTNTGDQNLSGYATLAGSNTQDFAARRLTTSDIGTATAQPWRLGTVKTGTGLVVLTTSYVEIEINGVIVKLAQIT